MTTTLAQARDILRAELLAAAAAAVPSFEGVVTRDPGPINPGAMFDGRGPATVCSITVETGDPAVTDAAGTQVAAAGRALAGRGWTVDLQPVESGHHRLAARRDGYDIVVHGWAGEWRITLVGETPEIEG
jgi:hypothetical protein